MSMNFKEFIIPAWDQGPDACPTFADVCNAVKEGRLNVQGTDHHKFAHM
jgi:hypothetical protein